MATKTKRVYFGDNLWRDVPIIAMDAAAARENEQEDNDEGEALARHIADAVVGALDSWNKGKDSRRRGRDSEDPAPTVESSHRPAHRPPTERSMAGDSRRGTPNLAAARDAFPAFSRLRM